MTPQQHWNKALRLEESRKTRLATGEDQEMIIWSCTHGGNQLLNVMYHSLGITSHDTDMIHTFVPDFVPTMDQETYDFYITLKNIEKLAPMYVRGAETAPREAIELCRMHYEKLKTMAAKHIQQDG